MAAELELYCDIVNNRLVTGFADASQFAVGQLFQGSALAIKFWPVKPNGNAVGNIFDKIPLSALTLGINIGPRAGAESLLAGQETWATNFDAGAQTGFLSATLDLNTTNLNTAIGNSDVFQTYLEIRLGESGVYRVVYQTPLTVTSVVRGPSGASSLPLAAVQYYTKAEMDALFVKYLGNRNGSTIDLPSPDGSKHRIIGANNDGTALDDIGT